VPIKKPEFISSVLPLNGHWVSGFITADGSFTLGYTEDSDRRFNAKLIPMFKVTQHNKDLLILERIKNVFNVGTIYTKRIYYAELQIFRIKQLTDIVIPFFDTYPLLGAKALDFIDFKTGMIIISSGEHLTQSGLNRLKTIYKGMNSGRSVFKY
jgi:hypothetical protein